MVVEAYFPEFIELTAGAEATKHQDVFCSGHTPEHAIDGQQGSPLALPARFGLVSGVEAVGGLLQQISRQLVGRLENGRADQHFQLLDGRTVGLGSLEASHQELDFLLLGEADLEGEFFGLGRDSFLTPIFN